MRRRRSRRRGRGWLRLRWWRRLRGRATLTRTADGIRKDVVPSVHGAVAGVVVEVPAVVGLRPVIVAVLKDEPRLSWFGHREGIVARCW